MTSSAAPATAADPESTGALISPQRRNVIFVAVMLGMLLAALDQTIVATALPTVVADLGGAGHQSWVVTSYLLASTVVTAIAGKLGDLFGRKAIFCVSVVFFLVGSVLCGMSGSMTMLVASRALQGIGGGAIMVTATALIGEVIPLRDRGRYRLRNVAGRPGCELDVARLWALTQIYRNKQAFGSARLTEIADRLRVPCEVIEPTFVRLVETGYALRTGDQFWLTQAGVRQVDVVSSALVNRILDKLACSPTFEGRPDRAQVEAARERIAHRVLVQRDWAEERTALVVSGVEPPRAHRR